MLIALYRNIIAHIIEFIAKAFWLFKPQSIFILFQSQSDSKDYNKIITSFASFYRLWRFQHDFIDFTDFLRTIFYLLRLITNNSFDFLRNYC